MAKYDETIRRAKKETATTTMFTVSIELWNDTEFSAFTDFAAGLLAARKDPFAGQRFGISTLEVAAKTAAAMKFDELVPADDPPEATAGPTWAPHPPTNCGSCYGSYSGASCPCSTPATPTEDDAVAAFKNNATSRSSDAWKELLAKYNAARVKDIAPSERAAFIAECARVS